jgi:hypothetical protein
MAGTSVAEMVLAMVVLCEFAESGGVYSKQSGYGFT